MPRFFKKTTGDGSASEPLNETSSEPANEGDKSKNGRFKFSGARRGRSSSSNRRDSSPFRETTTSVVQVQQKPQKQQTTKPKQSKPKLLERLKGSGSRRGATFCGYCDMRIATSLLNILHMIGAITRELIEASVWGNRNYLHDPPMLLLLALGISCMGLLGSLRFNNFFLILSTLSLPFMCHLYVGEAYYFLLAIAIMLIFAQVGLAKEISRGIMSEETYAREEYIDESGKAIYTTVQEKALEISDGACGDSTPAKTQTKDSVEL